MFYLYTNKMGNIIKISSQQIFGLDVAKCRGLDINNINEINEINEINKKRFIPQKYTIHGKGLYTLIRRL
jgi:hypothetical protein